jgi:transposase-like protein
MPHVATLSLAQERAVSVLATRRNVAEAARAAGVNRTTVHRWIRGSEAFQQACETRRSQLRSEVQNRLFSIADKAVDVIEQALDDGDPKTALAVLRGIGLLSGDPAPGAADRPPGTPPLTQSQLDAEIDRLARALGYEKVREVISEVEEIPIVRDSSFSLPRRSV